MKCIFVYGTLRSDMYNYNRYLKGKVLHSQKAYVKGHLHELKDVNYPALLDGEQWIVGEIMELDDTFSFEVLDALEGYIAEQHIDNEYDKVCMDIYDETFHKIDQLMVYRYNVRTMQRKSNVANRIVSNDYVMHIKKQFD